MEKSFGKYFIAIIPDELIVRMVRKIRERYAEIIEVSKTPIHATIKESFLTSRIDECITKLEGVSKDFKHFDVDVVGYDLFSDKHLVFKIKNNKELQALHEAVMQASQEFVDSVKPYLHIEKLSSLQESLLQKYNNPYCFQFYNPHISVGSISSPSDLGRMSSELRKLSLKSRFSVNYIAVVDKQKNEIYHKISLK